MKEEIMKGVVWEQYPKERPTGQQAGIPIIGWRLTHPDFQFAVYCKEFRSSYKNKEMCKTLFELFLMELIR